MKIEIELDEAKIRQVALDAALGVAKVEFERPTYRGDRGGAGYQAVYKQVKESIANMNCHEIVAQTVAQLLPAVCRDAVSEQLAKLVKAEIKAQRKSGTLIGNQMEMGAK